MADGTLYPSRIHLSFDTAARCSQIIGYCRNRAPCSTDRTMARPSKLTDKQWAEIERRHVKGEKIRALAREYGVSEGAIRARVTTQSAEIKAVAHQIVATEERFNALPISAQVSARSLADDLRAISSHLAGAGMYGAINSHRLSMIANKQVEMLDESAGLEENTEALKSVMAFTKTANEASVIGMNLLKANQEMIKDLNNPDEEPTPRTFTYNVIDGRVDADTDAPTG